MDNNQKDNTVPNNPNSGELEHLDKHDEATSQFDYAHLQVNQQPTDTLPMSQQSAELLAHVAQPVPQRPIDAKIGLLRNWLIIIGVYATFFVAGSYLPDSLYRIFSSLTFIVFITVIATQVRALKAKPDDTLTEKERTIMVFVMAVGVMIAQAIYWFSLKKQRPNIAKVALKIGWKVFIIWLIYIAIFVGGYIAQSWTFQNADKFNASLDVIKQDAQGLVAAANSDNAERARAECQDIVTHTKEMQLIEPYTDKQIQSDIENAQNKIINGAGNCVRGIDDNSELLIKQAAAEISDGAKQLDAAIKAINEQNGQ